MNADRLLAFAAALGCKALEVRDCLRSLAGNGRPASLDEHFAQVPRDPAPAFGPVHITSCENAARAFADALAAWDEPTPIGDEVARDLADLAAVNTYEDFLHLTGGDA